MDELYEIRARIDAALHASLPADQAEALLADVDAAVEAAGQSARVPEDRETLLDELGRALSAARRHDEPLAVIVAEHPTGWTGDDEQALAEQLADLIRSSDRLARPSDGSFAVVLGRTGTMGAALVAARIERVVPGIRLGRAVLETDDSPAALLERAEAELLATA